MSVIGSNILAGASAAASADDGPPHAEDVFSTYLYEGQTTSTITIDNGLDLAGKGGLVWIKRRDGAAVDHYLFDTERTNKYLNSSSTSDESDASTTDYINSYTSTGFVTGSSGNIAWQDNFVSWSFRKAPGFFDIVTYTGTGSARTVAHNLGSAPGMIIIKCTSNISDWSVYHRSMGATKNMHLNNDSASDTQSGVFNDAAPTATYFTVNTDTDVNGSGRTYVAYLFAHADASFGADQDEPIIRCGSFNGGGVLNSNTIKVNTVFEPQFVLIKRVDSTGDWYLMDTMRGMDNDGNDDPQLSANSTSAESNSLRFWVYQNGFAFDESLGGSSAEYIYMAIRRPHKTPESGTDVFAIDTFTGSTPNYISGFPVDLFITKDNVNSTSDNDFGVRLAGKKLLRTNSNLYQASSTTTVFDYQNGHSNSSGSADSTDYSWMFKRAPGFMDVVVADYPGTSTSHLHNLGVAPELIISKPRTGFIGWMVGSDYLPNTTGWNRFLYLDLNVAEGGTTTIWNQTAPTAERFYLGSYPGSSYEGIFILFATLAGVSKVGSYSGSAGSVSVDCGFSSGARFVLIKRIDSTGDWYVWDSVRGINSGSSNDPYFLLNVNDAQVQIWNYIDPLDAGFTVNSNAPAALNDSGGTYLFLAIA